MNESHLNEWIMIVIAIYREFDLDSFISCLIDVDLKYRQMNIIMLFV